MFDFGFSELMVIGAVGLVVLGPKRLPVVAREVGQWIGKAQRFVQQVKGDIARESELAELKDIQKQAESVARDINDSLRTQAADMEKSWADLRKETESASGVPNLPKNEHDLSVVLGEPRAKVPESAPAVSESAPAPAQLPGALQDPAPAQIPPAPGGSASEKLPEPSVESAPAGGAFEAMPEGYLEAPAPAAAPKAEEKKAEPDYTYDAWGRRGSWVFDRRYLPGPSMDDVAAQVERIQVRVDGRGSRPLGSSNRYAPCSRSSRVRIYR